MRIWINSDFKKWNENIIQDGLERCHSTHTPVHIVQSWKLQILCLKVRNIVEDAEKIAAVHEFLKLQEIIKIHI